MGQIRRTDDDKIWCKRTPSFPCHESIVSRNAQKQRVVDRWFQYFWKLEIWHIFSTKTNKHKIRWDMGGWNGRAPSHVLVTPMSIMLSRARRSRGLWCCTVYNVSWVSADVNAELAADKVDVFVEISILSWLGHQDDPTHSSGSRKKCSRGGGKLSIHFCAVEGTIETVFRKIILLISSIFMEQSKICVKNTKLAMKEQRDLFW